MKPEKKPPAAPLRPLTVVPEPDPPRPDGAPEQKFRSVINRTIKAFGKGGPMWAERDALRQDLHRSVDVYFAEKVAEKSMNKTGGSK